MRDFKTAEDPTGAQDAPNDRGEPFFPERLSSVLRRLARREEPTIAIGDISRALKDRGFGALMILFAAPNLIPMPPGTSTVFGLPLIFIAVQLIIGYRKPLLPRRVRYHEFSTATFRGIVSRLEPWIERFEKVARPRAWILPQRVAEQVVGVVAVILGLVLILPIPFGNFFPGVAIILLCLGLGERDGLWTAAGILAAVLSLGIMIGVVATAGVAVLSFF